MFNDATRLLMKFLENDCGHAEPLIVGGAVRDFLLGGEPKDIDIEVRGVPEKFLVSRLKAEGFQVDEVGRSFGVIKVKFGGQEFDISLPRTERKTGEGHTGFETTVDPFLPVKEAFARRDFTINAIGMDVEGWIIDPFGGVRDLLTKTLRHVGPQFGEDPLRVLRGVQFAARFGLTTHPETLSIMRGLVTEMLKTVAIERVFGEFEKMALKGSIGPGAELLNALGLHHAFAKDGIRFRPNEIGDVRPEVRTAAVFAAMGVDPVKVGAPKTVVRQVNELNKMLMDVTTPRRVLARQMQHVTFRDAVATFGALVRTDPAVLDGPTAPFLTGDDLIEMGFKPGPGLGQALEEVTNLQDRQVIVNREGAIARARSILDGYERRGNDRV